MAELNYKLRRKVLNYADELAAMAVRAPDRSTKRMVYAVVQSLRRDFGFSDEQKEVEVRVRILDGASTINDLVIETKFNRDDITKIVKKFEAAGKVELREIRSGSRGRPMVCIFPTDQLK